ncbi:MAG TPA: radical SAM protein [Cyclobacteriaceae bacterium]|nr:radical SAM protein [Cyclobacteriaceae bacterium]
MLNKKKRRDPWFLDDYTVNPYSGCSFNCTFCYIRGSKYGVHMERSMSVKENAIAILDKQLSLRARKNQYGIIVVSSATEPYLQIEPEQQLTRNILELILRYRFPVHVITRSNLVTRDFDILEEINKNAILPPDLEGRVPAKALITFSFSTLDDNVAHLFEPGATPPSKRLDCVNETLARGFYSGISLMPLLPYITDSEADLERFYSTFSGIGVKYIFPASITLFGDGPAASKTLTLRVIDQYFPQLTESYTKLFATGYQIDYNYHKAFDNRVAGIRKKYNIPDKILLS